MHPAIRSVLASASAAALLLVSPAVAQEWPRLRETDGSAICTSALSIAKEAFASNLRTFTLLRAIGDGHSARLVLHRTGNDISGGHALAFDPATLAEIPDGPPDDYYGQRSIYWQHRPQDGLRFVAVENAHSWRGDVYTVFALPETISSATFLASPHHARYQKGILHPPIIENAWQPPLFLRDDASGKVFFIDAGAPWEILAGWKVYATGSKGAAQPCVVQFRPDAAGATELMPPEVRDLMASLDATLGDGRNDGTSARTSVLRNFAASVWANAARRPWAVIDGPERASRAYVDQHLETWSRKAKSFAAVHDDIIRQYPVAERALAHHYVAELGMTETEAVATATRILDIAFRSNFTF